MFYKLLTSTHLEIEPNGKQRVYVASDPDNNIVETDKPLDKLFPNKFEPLEKLPKSKKKKKKKKSKKQAKEKPPEEELANDDIVDDEVDNEELDDDEDVPPLGEDVTDQFAAAVDEDLLVFMVKKGNRKAYLVATGDEPNTPLNDKPLGKKKVEEFLSSYSEEEV